MARIVCSRAERLGNLGKVVRAHKEFLAANAGLTPFTLGIVSSHTMDYLAAVLPATGLRYSLLIDVALADYGQAAQQLLDPASSLLLNVSTACSSRLTFVHWVLEIFGSRNKRLKMRFLLRSIM